MLIVRQEVPGDPGDVKRIHSVVGSAFASADAEGEVPVEVWLLEELRRDDGWLPALSLVATEPSGGHASEHQIVGHVVCTRGAVEGEPALGLGPLAVRPDRQGRGVGSALMYAVLGAADALGEPMVMLLGEPGYYARFGFEPAADWGITAPDAQWGNYFQARALSAYRHRPVKGAFAYAEPFSRL